MEKKSYFFICLFILITTIVNAQFGPEQVISTDADGSRRVFAADLNGDSLKDVLSANKFGSNLTWYKNLGDGTFGPQQIIASINQPINLYAADLDGDNDMDVLAVSGPENWVVWYENLDGLGNFGPQQIIADDAILAYNVIAADIDGDLDMDVVSASDSSGLAWYENLDGLGSFSTKKVINASAPNSRSVMAVDLDGDTDLDIVGSTSGSVTVSWYENTDGLGNFGAQQVIAGSALTVSSVFAIDLDGDLDNDVIAATNAADKVSWYENLDGLGNFGVEQILTTLAISCSSVFAVDLDNDNDILFTSTPHPLESTSEIAWVENTDGIGNFGSKQIITNTLTFARNVYAEDLNNDGYIDVLSASQNDDKIAWYENLMYLDIEENQLSQITIIPNPVSGILTVSNNSTTQIKAIKIYDVLGKLILKEKEHFNSIDVSHLKNGLLFVQLETEQGSITKKVVKE